MGDFDRNAGGRRSGRGRSDRGRGGFGRGRSGGFGGRDRDDDRGRDRRSGGFDRRGRGRDRHEMHSATCDKCGNECEVPFKPTSGKPLYCDDCFKDKSREAGSRSEFGKPRNNENLDQINKKLDKILNILEGHVKEDKPKKKEKAKKLDLPDLEEPKIIEEKKPKKKKAKKKKS
tara:strand:+ start:8267 stop:8788 length:522 start_codon:yes stop_codon:yes gene_type:complete